MTVSSQKGVLSVALQPGKVGKDGTFDASLLDYYKMRASRVSFGPVDSVQIFPLQVGDNLTPTGSYKDMFFAAGDADFIPPMKEHFGILLAALFGQTTTTTGEDAYGTAVTGLNSHLFTFAADNSIPWLSVRRMVPGAITADNSGETAFDCKIVSLRLQFPQRGKVSARASFVGRDLVFGDPTSWAYENASFENDLSTVDSWKGTFAVGGIEYPSMGATLEIMNNLTSPTDEMIVGDHRPDDFIVLSRLARIRLVYKYRDDDLCRQIYTGSPDGLSWTGLPFYTDLVGSNKAFDAYFQSAGNIAGQSFPYGFRLSADRVVWGMEAPPELVGGGFLAVTFTGTVIQPDTGNYLEATMENEADGTIYVPGDIHTLAFAGTLSYDGTPVDQLLDGSATLTNFGWSSWRQGKVALQWGVPTVGTLDANDSFSIDTTGNFSIASNVLSHSAVEIGTITGGTWGENLVVSLNAAATTAIVEELIQSLKYGRIGGATATDSFPVTLVIADAAGNTKTDTIVITHV